MTGAKSWRECVLAGEPFRMPDWDFIATVGKARDQVAEFNRTPNAQPERRLELLKGLFGKFGEGSRVEPILSLDLGFNIEIGERSFINCNCILLDTYPIRIGDDVQIGPGTMLFAAGHPVRAADRKIFDPVTGAIVGDVTTGAPVVIEDRVWLGGGVIVMPGITIGARSTIGSGSVVTKSVPPDVAAAGNPCRVIRAL